MKHSQCNDYTALTVQWHKAIMQIVKVLYKWNNISSARRYSHKYRDCRWAVLCACRLQQSTDNQQSFVLDHSHRFVSNLLQSQPLLSGSWKVDVILYALLLGRFTQSLCHLFTIYKWQAKQQNTHFEITVITEVYFTNDWRKNKI